MKSLTTEQFIEKATGVHGCLFDYSMVEYVNSRTKVKIFCKIHGWFEQIPYSHIRGFGCKRCAQEKTKLIINRESKKANKRCKEDFIKKSKVLHGNKYDYSETHYLHSLKKVKIICPKHGAFFQTPCGHLKGSGCQKCSHESLVDKGWLEKFRKVHGDRYDYSKVIYFRSSKKVEIVCKIHGSFFQKPNDHIMGHNCRKCSMGKVGKKKADKTWGGFIERANKIHNNKYDYSKVVFKNVRGKIKIICPVHGEFEQTAMNHLVGNGCSSCFSGFDPSIPAILYYLEIETDTMPVYKIGISNKTVYERYPSKQDREKIKVLKVWEYPLGSEARKMERKILKKHKGKIYGGDPLLKRLGTTEIFSEDVLMLSEQYRGGER